MKNERLWTKVRFLTSVSALYIITIGIVWLAVQPNSATQQTAYASVTEKIPPATQPKSTLISGKPVRIVITDSGIDLAIDEGSYNTADGSWTLSDIHAEYAVMSALANNEQGNTFIYGHGTMQVFGPLVTSPPQAGTVALIYTDNGHIFSYTFQGSRDQTPEDTSVLSYQGPPIITIQTCTGAVSEWRTMFQFNFEKVIQ